MPSHSIFSEELIFKPDKVAAFQMVDTTMVFGWRPLAKSMDARGGSATPWSSSPSPSTRRNSRACGGSATPWSSSPTAELAAEVQPHGRPHTSPNSRRKCNSMIVLAHLRARGGSATPWSSSHIAELAAQVPLQRARRSPNPRRVKTPLSPRAIPSVVRECTCGRAWAWWGFGVGNVWRGVVGFW